MNNSKLPKAPEPVGYPVESDMQRIFGPLIIMPDPDGHLYAVTTADFETVTQPDWKRIGKG